MIDGWFIDCGEHNLPTGRNFIFQWDLSILTETMTTLSILYRDGTVRNVFKCFS